VLAEIVEEETSEQEPIPRSPQYAKDLRMRVDLIDNLSSKINQTCPVRKAVVLIVRLDRWPVGRRRIRVFVCLA
jgi:hypothetical protein